MKNLKMFAAFVHCLSIFTVGLAFVVAYMNLVPNSELMWSITVILVSSTIATTAMFFLHDKHWYYTREELQKEQIKYQNAFTELLKLRSKYINKLESSDENNNTK